MPDGDGLFDITGELLGELLTGALGLIADQGADVMKQRRLLVNDASRRSAQEMHLLCVAMWKILQRDYQYDPQKLKNRIMQMHDNPQKLNRLINKYVQPVSVKSKADIETRKGRENDDRI